MQRFVDIKKNRVEFLDERYYEIAPGVFYPSVTTILDTYPKGPQFLQWVKDVGNNAKMIAERAAESGTKVHSACEQLINGEELEWDDSQYNLEEWKGVLKFVDFATRFKPEWEASEITTVSETHKYAGTIDIICKMNNARWLLDIKFGNAVYITYFLQLTAYAASWEETNPEYPIDKIGVLHLKAATRTEAKGKLQGIGWKIEEPKDSREKLFDIFKRTLDLYMFENPESKPRNFTLPRTAKL